MKILVFAPHSAIWIHAFPEALVAESLQKSGHEIVYVTCGRLFKEYCIPMSASGIRYDASADEKLKVCEKCDRNAGILRREFGFAGLEMASSISEEDYADVQAFLARVTRQNFQAILFAGLQVGRFALYQFLILRKRIGFDFSDEEWGEYLLGLKATLLAVAVMRHVLIREKPDRVLLYNGLYSVNMACSTLAARHGAISYFLHAGSSLARRLQTLMLGRDHTFRFYPALMHHWPRYRGIAISAERMRPTTDHFIALLSGRSAFAYSAVKSSSTFEVRRKFGIDAGQKILVAAMSSYDEEFAAEAVGARVHVRPSLFATQAEWIKVLLTFVAERPDLFLIVRVHPRELPNRREGVKSEHAAVLERQFVGLPGNAAVNWPTDGISLYDLAEEADVFLNAWSSVGKEMSQLGRPVVTYAKDVIFYPAELNYTGNTVVEYLSQIDRALADGWDVERIRMVYRWMAIELGRGLIDIGESYAQKENNPMTLTQRVVRKLHRTFEPNMIQRRDCDRRAPQLKEAELISRLIASGSDTVLDVLDVPELDRVDHEQETEALRAEIRRLMPYLYPNAGTIQIGTLRAHLSAFSGVRAA